MAIYTPDYKYQAGKKFLEDLKGEPGELIRYYVEQKDKHIKNLQKHIEEMQEVFNGIKRFTR